MAYKYKERFGDTTPVEVYDYGLAKVTLQPNGHKWLFIGENLSPDKGQSEIDPTRPWWIDWFYCHGTTIPMLFGFQPKSVLVLGLGGGMLLRMIKSTFPDIDMTCVEIHPEVVQAAKDHFMVDDYDYELIVGDGYEYLMETEKKFDLIIMDAFDIDVVGLNTMNSYETYVHMRDNTLNDGGYLCTNIVRKYQAVEKAMNLAFNFHTFKGNTADSYDTQLIFGAKDDKKHSYLLSDLRAKAEELNEANLKWDIDHVEMLECLLRKTNHTNHRLTF